MHVSWKEALKTGFLWVLHTLLWIFLAFGVFNFGYELATYRVRSTYGNYYYTETNPVVLLVTILAFFLVLFVGMSASLIKLTLSLVDEAPVTIGKYKTIKTQDSGEKVKKTQVNVDKGTSTPVKLKQPKQTRRFCDNCGFELIPNSKFCPNCGKILTE